MRNHCSASLILLLGAVGCAGARRPPSAALSVDSIRVVELKPGVTHTYAWDRTGPWAIHVVRIDRARCNPVLEVRKRGIDLRLRAPTSALGTNALAAVNADFFAIPAGNPVGAHVTAGRPLAGPHATRPVFAVTRSGWLIDSARLDGFVVSRTDSIRITQLNRARGERANALTMMTSALGDSLPRDSLSTRVWLRLLQGDETRGRAVVTRIDSSAHELRKDSASWVLFAHGSARAWAARRVVGDTIAWTLAVLPRSQTTSESRALEATGGFPELLRAGAAVPLPETPFAQQRHPRSAIGWTANQSALLLVVVDGRQPPYSDGMTLAELTALFRRLGATDALNLDGGGSTTMIVAGKVVNRPSDAGRERPVGNALALARCQ